MPHRTVFGQRTVSHLHLPWLSLLKIVLIGKAQACISKEISVCFGNHREMLELPVWVTAEDMLLLILGFTKNSNLTNYSRSPRESDRHSLSMCQDLCFFCFDLICFLLYVVSFWSCWSTYSSLFLALFNFLISMSSPLFLL